MHTLHHSSLQRLCDLLCAACAIIFSVTFMALATYIPSTFVIAILPAFALISLHRLSLFFSHYMVSSVSQIFRCACGYGR